MRISKTTMALCIVAGSFFLYCGQSAMQGGSGSNGPVGSANGQSSGGGGTCCTPPGQTFTKLASGDFSNGAQQPVATAGYRALILYASGSCILSVSFRADASSPFT